jgi:hypothetical protein
MKSVSTTDVREALANQAELREVAKRVIWFEPPTEALSDINRFLAYVMTFGTPDDLAVVRRFLTLADFQRALENAPPGIIDARSWTYWNLVCGRDPETPMPVRQFPV